MARSDDLRLVEKHSIYICYVAKALLKVSPAFEILDATQRAFFIEMGSRIGGLMITNAIQHKYGLVMNEAAYKLQAGFNYQLSPQPPMTESGFLTVLPQNGRLVKFNVAPLRPEVQHLETNFEIVGNTTRWMNPLITSRWFNLMHRMMMRCNIKSKR